MLLIKFVPNSTIRMCSSGTIFLKPDDICIYTKYDANMSKKASNKYIFYSTACIKGVQIRYHKGAGTKMHKCKVGFKNVKYLILLLLVHIINISFAITLWYQYKYLGMK